MVKIVLVSAISGVLASALFLFGLVSCNHANQEGFKQQHIAKFSSAINSNVNAVASLRADMAELEQKLAGQFTSLSIPSEIKSDILEDLTVRVEKLELASEGFSSDGLKLDHDLRASVKRIFDDDDDADAAMARTQLYEEKYDVDMGVPLGNFPESIRDVFHSSEDIELAELDCKETICKITYSKSNASTNDRDANRDLELADKLAIEASGYQVDVMYAKDSYGNDIMYVQLR